MPQLLDGLRLTVVLGIQSMILSVVIGVIGAVSRQYGAFPLRIVAVAYVELIRNTPLLVQIFVVFFTLPAIGLRLDPETAGLVALSANGGAYMTEIIRAGLVAIPKGQVEAAYALGLSGPQALRDVIGVPALKIIYPALVSQCVVMLLNTSICSQIAVNELTATVNTIDSNTFRSFELYVLLVVVYVALSFLFGIAFRGFRKLAFRWEL
ncbi:MAG: amino acid ABC transporter permease [Rhizobium sp.]